LAGSQVAPKGLLIVTLPSLLNEDFRDLLIELLDGEVRFVVVGAHAMAVHGVPRATGDLDVLEGE
jgi:hypothetical protein